MILHALYYPQVFQSFEVTKIMLIYERSNQFDIEEKIEFKVKQTHDV